MSGCLIWANLSDRYRPAATVTETTSTEEGYEKKQAFKTNFKREWSNISTYMHIAT